MKYVSTLEQHLQNPDEPVGQYARRRRIELAQEIRGATKIYLDTKYWLLLRDARLGCSVTAEVNNLLSRLEFLVRAKRALCPLSVDTYAEVFKQSIPSTLRATLRLIDDLSMGVTILETGERVRTEVFHFIQEKTKGSEAVHCLDDLVWTKAAYVLGFVTPTFPDLEDAYSVAIQKAFVDQMWVVTLEDMLDVMGAHAVGREGWFSEQTADHLNKGKFSHMNEYSSFKQLFLNELAGVLDYHKPTFADLMAHIYASDTRNPNGPTEAQRAESGRLTANLIYNAFRLNKIKAELPTFRVGSALHAAVRWDAQRKYKMNDLHDIHHAVAAIPYCDWFFTERNLCELVNNKNLRFSSFFKCRTVADIGEALSAISTI